MASFGQYRQTKVYTVQRGNDEGYLFCFQYRRNNILEKVDTYKYLGVPLGFRGDVTIDTEVLRKAVGRTLGKYEELWVNLSKPVFIQSWIIELVSWVRVI